MRMDTAKEHLTFRVFRSTLFTSWDSIFQEAADFATQIGRENVMCISHSDANLNGIVTVWYWVR